MFDSFVPVCLVLAHKCLEQQLTYTTSGLLFLRFGTEIIALPTPPFHIVMDPKKYSGQNT